MSYDAQHNIDIVLQAAAIVPKSHRNLAIHLRSHDIRLQARCELAGLIGFWSKQPIIVVALLDCPHKFDVHQPNAIVYGEFSGVREPAIVQWNQVDLLPGDHGPDSTMTLYVRALAGLRQPRQWPRIVK